MIVSILLHDQIHHFNVALLVKQSLDFTSEIGTPDCQLFAPDFL